MSEDLIKRSDAIKDLCDISNNSDMPEDWHRGLSVAISALYRVPPVPPADRPQGEWILLEPRYPIEQKVYWNKEQALADTKGNGAIERRKCSCCGYAKSFMCHMKDEQIKLWNFCPNCGCRMKGADDER